MLEVIPDYIIYICICYSAACIVDPDSEGKDDEETCQT